MGKVLTNILKDSAGVYADGVQRSVDSSSAIIGMRTIALADYPVADGTDPVPTILCLLVVEPRLGSLWIDETVASWTAKMGESNASPDATHSFTWTGGVDVPVGSTITDARLHNITILSISKGGIGIYNVPYSNPTTTEGRLDLTNFGKLTDGETIQITFNYN